MFRNIGLIPKPGDELSRKTILQLSNWLFEKKLTVLTEADAIKKSADLIIVIGGDGTILASVREFIDADIPILGVNLGRLGFLADVGLDEMHTIILQAIDGDFISEKRTLLHCVIEKISAKGEHITTQKLAFNDAVVHRQQGARIIEFETYINNKFVNSQRADGLIINTPTGSTAYALSSGGPIIHPSVDAIAVVPICPHTLSNRPLLISADSEIRIKLSEPNANAIVSFDAQSNLTLTEGQTLVICKYKNSARFIHPKHYDYFEIMRTKLKWSGKF